MSIPNQCPGVIGPMNFSKISSWARGIKVSGATVSQRCLFDFHGTLCSGCSLHACLGDVSCIIIYVARRRTNVRRGSNSAAIDQAKAQRFIYYFACCMFFQQPLIECHGMKSMSAAVSC